MIAAAAAAALLLLTVHLGRSCDEEGRIMICRNIPSHFSPGSSTLVMYVSDVGEINSTVFRSSNLASVTRLRIDGAGVTGIAEGAFASLRGLASASLDRNALTRVNPRWFGRPAVLRELSLAGNRVEAVDGSALNGLIGLTRLSLSKNRIRTVEPSSFLSQASLAELDLSGNRMTRVSPQVFSSLGATRIRLDGNPWDCSCGAEGFVLFLRDLRSRSLLDRDAEVTCETPAPLRGRPAWNVSVCATSPAPGPAPPSPTVHHETTGATLPATSGTSAQVVTTPSQPEPKAETSVPTKATDEPVTISSRSATPPAPEASVRATDGVVTLHAHTATYVTTTPSETLTPPLTAVAETCVTSGQLSDPDAVCTLLVVTVVVCVPLLVACFLAAQHRRKRNNNNNNNSVTPGCHGEEENNLEGDGGGSDLAAARRRPSPGVAVPSVSPPRAPGKDRVTVQSETGAQSTDTENRADGKQGPENGAEATGGLQADGAERNEKQADADRRLDEKPRCVSASAGAVPYLRVGTDQSKPNPDGLDKQSADSSGQRSRMGKAMGRISTWPPTAAQWQARCKTKEEEEEEEEEEESETGKFPGEVKKHPSVSDGDEEEDEDEIQEARTEASLTALNQDPQEMNAARTDFTHAQSSKLHFSEARAETEEDAAAGRRTVCKTPNQDLGPADKTGGGRSSSSEAGRRNEPKRAVASRQRAESGRAGPAAPSGGASPDDETLLRGHEHASMDLLHEVVQNNGRWTRERWRRMQVNKQQQRR